MLRREWVALALMSLCVGSATAATQRAKPMKRAQPAARVQANVRMRSAAPAQNARAQKVRRQVLWHVGRGFQFYESRAFDDAAKQFRQALRLEPRNPRLYSVLGDVYATQRDQLPRAVDAYRAALRLTPRDTALLERLGVTYERLDKPHLAASVYKNVIWIDARDSSAHQHLGWALHRQGKKHEAILAYERALQLDPKNSIARCRLNQLKPASSQLAHRLPGRGHRA